MLSVFKGSMEKARISLNRHLLKDIVARSKNPFDEKKFIDQMNNDKISTEVCLRFSSINGIGNRKFLYLVNFHFRGIITFVPSHILDS